MDLLLNWLAHGSIVGMAAAAVLRLLPAAWTDVRARVIWSACGLVVLAPMLAGLTFLPGAAAATVAAPFPLEPVVALPLRTSIASSIAGGVWLLWATTYLCRLVVAGRAVREALQRAHEYPPHLQGRLRHWSSVRQTGRRTRLVLSPAVASAAVLGLRAPVIALSPHLLARLSDDDLDRIVLHEWAHIQRRDDMMQLVQRAMHAIAGWHPALRWLERQLELERELACDRVAVRVTGTAKDYATCLAAVATLNRQSDALPRLAVSSGELTRRVRMILSRTADAQPWGVAALPAAAALAVVALTVSGVPVVAIHQPPPVAVVSAAVESSHALARSSASPHVPSPSRDTVTVAPIDSAPATLPPRRAHANTRRPEVSEQVAAKAAPAPQVRIPIARGNEMPAPAVASPLAATPGLIAMTPALMIEGAGRHREPIVETALVAASERARSPWDAAADSAVSLGRQSRDAGVAIGGFFSRVGKSVADSF